MAIRPRQKLPELLELAPLPAVLAMGKEARFPLFKEPVKGKFSVLKGAASATISDDGVFSWTPAANEMGTAWISIRSVVDGHADIHLFKIEVVPADRGPRGP